MKAHTFYSKNVWNKDQSEENAGSYNVFTLDEKLKDRVA